MTMEKKKYIAPVMTVVMVNTQYQMLAGSEVGVSNTEYSSENNGGIRSRGGSWFDDEE